MTIINSSKHVLLIGPHYSKLKGGISSVLAVYRQYFPNFRFISTINSYNKIITTLQYPVKLLYIIIYLALNKDIKIVHFHGASYGSFFRKYIVFVVSKYLLRKRTIYHIHGGGFQEFYNKSASIIKALIQDFINNTDVIVCLTESWEIFFNENFNPQKVIVVNNIIEEPESNLRSDVSTDRIVFLFLGKICKEKGVYDLLESIHNELEYFQDKVQIKIGGDGDIGALQKEISNLKLGSIVKFIGWVDNSQKQSVFKNADVFVLPSHYEVLPISILEAMSYGLPIISTRIGGIPDIIKNEINGFLFTPGDTNTLEKHIRFFIENRSVIKAFGKNAREMVKAYYPSKVLESLDSLYKELLEIKEN